MRGRLPRYMKSSCRLESVNSSVGSTGGCIDEYWLARFRILGREPVSTVAPVRGERVRYDWLKMQTFRELCDMTFID